MSGGDDSDRRWLLKPIGPQELRIHVDVGADVEVSDEARAALDAFLGELYTGEVAGFASNCPDLRACSPRYECIPLGNCQTLTKNPCFADVWCFIRREA